MVKMHFPLDLDCFFSLDECCHFVDPYSDSESAYAAIEFGSPELEESYRPKISSAT